MTYFEELFSVDKTKSNLDNLNKSFDNVYKVQEKFSKGMGQLSAWTIAKGQLMANAIGNIFSGIKDNLFTAMPFMSQSMEMAKTVMLTNLAYPLAQELLPIIQKFFSWISENRINFAKFGTVFVSIFRVIKTTVSTVFDILKKSVEAFWDKIGGGKVTMNNLINYINFLLFKVTFVISFVLALLEPAVVAIGEILGSIWTNYMKPTIDEIGEGLSFLAQLFLDPQQAMESFDTTTQTVFITALIGGMVYIGLFSKTLIISMIPSLLSATTAMISFAASMAPFALIGLVIAGVVLGVILLYKNWDKLKALAKSFLDYALQKWEELKETISNLWEKLKEGAEILGKKLQPLKALPAMLKEGFDNARLAFSSLLTSISNSSVFKVLEATYTNLKNAFSSNEAKPVNSSNPLVNTPITPQTEDKGMFAKAKDWIGFKEDGGRVEKGHPYIVGEKRPELFIPDQSGKIIPRVTPTNGSSSMGSNSYNDNKVININITGNNSQDIAKEVKRVISQDTDIVKKFRTSLGKY